MRKINELIENNYCNVVEYIPIWQLLFFDKRFKGVESRKQKKVVSFKHVSAEQLKDMLVHEGTIKLLSTGKFEGYTTEEKARGAINKGEVITIPSGGTANIKYYNGEFVDSGNILAVSSDNNKYDLKYIYHCMLEDNGLLQSYYRGGSVQHPEMNRIIDIVFPIPPIEVQREIVEILDMFVSLTTELTAELASREIQFDFYKEKLFNVEGEIKPLGAVSQIIDCLHATPEYSKVGYSMIRVADVKDGYIDTKKCYKVNEETYKRFIKRYKPQKNDIVISRVGSFGNFSLIPSEDVCLGQNVSIIHPLIDNKYLYYYLKSSIVFNYMNKNAHGGGYKNISIKDIISIPILVPIEEEQRKIAVVLEKFDSLCNDISHGLPAEIEARKKQYEYYRKKLLTFERIAQ